MKRLRNVFLLLCPVVVFGCDQPPDQALIAPEPLYSKGNVTAEMAVTKGFRKHVTIAGVREHQAAFQALADASGGTRSAGSAGGDASAAYIASRLQAAGYLVTSQEFSVPFGYDVTTPILEKTTPPGISYVDRVDFRTMSYSGNGDVTATIHAVHTNDVNSGCNAAHFAGFPTGSIALVRRGTCSFRTKAVNAQAAGAAAVIIFNNVEGVLAGSLGAPALTGLPVVGTTLAAGLQLGNGVVDGSTGATVRVRVDWASEMRTVRNVIAETPGGDASRVIVVGASFDSDASGPGINLASGAAASLEIAEVFAEQERTPRNKVRFIWFAAEQNGLLGARTYVDGLSSADRARIALMLDLDMLGSPNFIRAVLDGDNSETLPGPLNPAGSGTIEDVFRRYFTASGLAFITGTLGDGSEYGPFRAAGIPVGALWSSGTNGIKTAAEAALFGGTAGAPYDPCFFLPCDTYANTSETGLHDMTDAAAHAILLFSRRNFAREPLVKP
jgi:Zn-dependent M28 family amino/carboxypeptidase